MAYPWPKSPARCGNGPRRSTWNHIRDQRIWPRRNIKVSRKEAESFIEAYFHQYPGVKKYVEQLIADARFTGEARTLMGRLRKLPELDSRNFTLRSFAERMARNTPLQGTAADIINWRWSGSTHTYTSGRNSAGCCSRSTMN